MKAKYNGVTVEIKTVVDYAAPDSRYNKNRTVARTSDGTVLLEHSSTGSAASIPPWLDKLTDLSD